MKLARMVMVAVIAAGSASVSVVSADTASTRPAAQPKAHQNQQHETRMNMSQIRRELMRMFWGGRNVGVQPATQQEWDEMMAFMQQYSPARAHVLATLNLPPTSSVRLDAIRKWRTYTFTRDHLPALQDQLIQRFQLEDDLFALTLTAQANADMGLDQFHDKIQAKVQKLVELDFAERQTRIDKLEKLLDEEKAKLAADQQVEDKTVEQRTDAIMSRLEKLSHSQLASTTRPDGDQQASSDQQQDGQPHHPVVNVSSGTEAGGGK